MDHTVVGKRIVDVRAMTQNEMQQEGWSVPYRGARPVVMVLDDGTRLYASQDEEGNGPGAMFGATRYRSFVVIAKR